MIKYAICEKSANIVKVIVSKTDKENSLWGFAELYGKVGLDYDSFEKAFYYLDKAGIIEKIHDGFEGEPHGVFKLSNPRGTDVSHKNLSEITNYIFQRIESNNCDIEKSTDVKTEGNIIAESGATVTIIKDSELSSGHGVNNPVIEIGQNPNKKGWLQSIVSCIEAIAKLF